MFVVFYTKHKFYAAPTFPSAGQAMTFARHELADSEIIKPFDHKKPYAGGEQVGVCCVTVTFPDLSKLS